MIITIPHNLLLQPSKRLLRPLSIQQRHVDAKKTEQTIRNILLNSHCPSRSPRHPAAHTRPSHVPAPEQEIRRDARPCREVGLQSITIANLVPGCVEEEDRLGSDEFLQCPASRKPFGVCEVADGRGGIIRQIHKTDLRIPIPLVH